MKQSAEFDDVLNNCLERILNGETVEQCLTRFPQYAEKLKPLLDTGSQIRKSALVHPRQYFRDNARVQFQAALDKSGNKPKASFFSWLKQPQWAAVTAFTLLVVLGTATAALANGSMPDQPLYPVKLAMEKIQILLTPSAESRGELYARLLERRIDEITKMAAENKPDKMVLVTNSLDSMVTALAASTPASLENDTSKITAPQVTSTPPSAPAQVSPAPSPAAPAAAPAPVVPPTNQPGFTANSPPLAGATGMASPAANTTPRLTTGAGNVEATSATTNQLPSSDFTVLNETAANLARLRDLLASTPESGRPALQNAIAAVENTFAALVKYLAAK